MKRQTKQTVYEILRAVAAVVLIFTLTRVLDSCKQPTEYVTEYVEVAEKEASYEWIVVNADADYAEYGTEAKNYENDRGFDKCSLARVE